MQVEQGNSPSHFRFRFRHSSHARRGRNRVPSALVLTWGELILNMANLRVNKVNSQSRTADRTLKVRWETKQAEEVGIERVGSGRVGLGLGILSR